VFSGVCAGAEDTYSLTIVPFSFLFTIAIHSRSNWMYSGMETLLLGGACATLAFTIGKYVNKLIGEDEDVGIP
jgi:hypothetical protein